MSFPLAMFCWTKSLSAAFSYLCPQAGLITGSVKDFLVMGQMLRDLCETNCRSGSPKSSTGRSSIWWSDSPPESTIPTSSSSSMSAREGEKSGAGSSGLRRRFFLDSSRAAKREKKFAYENKSWLVIERQTQLYTLF